MEVKSLPHDPVSSISLDKRPNGFISIHWKYQRHDGFIIPTSRVGDDLAGQLIISLFQRVQNLNKENELLSKQHNRCSEEHGTLEAKVKRLEQVIEGMKNQHESQKKAKQ